MIDPLSTTAGIVGITAAVVHSIHVIIDLIDNIEAAPTTVRVLRIDLADTEGVVRNLESSLNDTAVSEYWTNMLRDTKLSSALDTLAKISERTSKYLEGWTKHSTPGGKLSLRDNFNIAFHDSKISQLRAQFVSCKQSVTLSMSSCSLLSQIQNSHDTTQRFDQLMAQQAIAIEYLATQTTTIETLRAEEHQLQIAKEASVDRGDDCEEARLSELMQDLSLARRAVRDFRTVSDYVAKSTAAQTGQDIGKVDIADSGFGAVGMSNIDQISDVKQRIGDVKVGNRATGFVGIHNNVDHNAALAAAAGRFSHMP